MQRRFWLGVMILGSVLASHAAYAGRLDTAVMFVGGDSEAWGRTTHLSLPIGGDFYCVLLHDSFDDLGFGVNNRWSLRGQYRLLDGALSLDAATGISLNSSYVVEYQTAWDLALRLQYGIGYLSWDQSWFRNGMYFNPMLGLDWTFLQHPSLALLAGIGLMGNTDYQQVGWSVQAFLGLAIDF